RGVPGYARPVADRRGRVHGLRRAGGHEPLPRALPAGRDGDVGPRSGPALRADAASARALAARGPARPRAAVAGGRDGPGDHPVGGEARTGRALMPRAGLDSESVVAAAAAMADEDGLEAVTLTRLAGRLGVRTPSLYAHVRGLDDLRGRLA